MTTPPTDTKEAPAINTHVRLFDLVRYLRSELHRDGLITDEEYAWLVAEAPMATSPKGGSPSRQRLEDYDELRAALAAQTERTKVAEHTVESLAGLLNNCADTLRSRGIDASVGPLDIRVIELAKRADRLQAEVQICRSALGIQIHEKIPEQTPQFGTILVDSYGTRRRIAPANDSELEIAQDNIRLTAELDAVRKERDKIRADFVYVQVQRDQACSILQGCELSKDEVTKSGLGEWVLIEQRHMARQRDAAQAKCAELEKLIQDAPHEPRCRTVTCSYYNEKEKRYVSLEQCTCWKSRLTPAPPEEKRP